MKVFLYVLLFFYVSSPDEVDVTGSWDMAVEASQGKATPVLTLRQDGEKVSGTYRGQMGQSDIQGTVKGNAIRFSVVLKFEDKEVTVVYSGTVTSNLMQGTVQFGGVGSGKWSAARR